MADGQQLTWAFNGDILTITNPNDFAVEVYATRGTIASLQILAGGTEDTTNYTFEDGELCIAYTCPPVTSPELSLRAEKVAAATSFSNPVEPGDTITYSVTVFNDSDVAVDVTESSNLANAGVVTIPANTSSTAFGFTYTLTAADISAGMVSCQMMFSGTDGDSTVMFVSDDPNDITSDGDPTVQVLPDTGCDSMFDCAAGNPAINGGAPVSCNSTVQITLNWVDCNGVRVPSGTAGAVGLSASIGTINFASASDETNTYNWTVPQTGNTATPVTFTYGEAGNLCTFTGTIEPCDPVTTDKEANIIPHIGYGGNSLFGEGGTVYNVTNLNDSGPGSWREAFTASGPRIVTFAVSGVAPAFTQATINTARLSVLGETAPGTGFKIQAGPNNNAAVIRTTTSDIGIRHVGFYQNNDATGNTNNRDVISISTGSNRVCLSNCTLMWGADETLQVWSGTTSNSIGDITIQYCLFAESLSETGHNSGEHSKAVLFGNRIDNVSIHHNYFVLNNRRNPRVSGADNAQIVNNVIIANSAPTATFRPITIGGNDPTKVQRFDLVSNKVYGMDGGESGCLLYPPNVFGSATESIYSSGNIGGNRTSNAQAEQDFYTGYGTPYTPATLPLQATPHTNVAPLITHADVTTDDLRDYLLANVGAHCWNRFGPDIRALNYQPDVETVLSAPPEGTMY